MLGIGDWLSAIKVAIITAIVAVIITAAYEKGGEKARAELAAQAVDSAAKASAAKAQWEVERAQLQGQVLLARSLVKAAANAAEQTESLSNARIEEALRHAKSQPMDADTIAAVSAIIAEGNR